MSSSRERSWVIVATGAGALLLVHAVLELGWQRFFRPAALERAWFMASKEGLIFTQVCLGLVALGLALARPGGWGRRLGDAALLAFGAMCAVIGLFFAIGPEHLMVGSTRLWPLSLAAAFFLLAPASLAGALLGGVLRGGRVGSPDPRDRKPTSAPPK